MVSQHTDLDTWKLADELRDLIIAFTGREPASRDGRFCSQIRSAIDSACANTAEGFGRYAPSEFRQFLRIARGSLLETQDHLRSARKRGFIEDEAHEKMTRLAERSARANTRLQAYLRSREAQEHAKAPFRPRTKNRT
jgi:four helix bundle protein